MRQVVTVDGPAGSGKSTVARIVAQRLGWRLLDTGAMYRAVALAALRAGIHLEDESALGALTEHLCVELPPGQVLLDGEDVSEAIRSTEVTRATKHAADAPSVRTRLVAWQRRFAAENDTITEGRDQGTIVFPDSPCKFFLMADPVERARRRHAEFVARGDKTPLEEVLRDLRERDARDESRAIAPLRPADDAQIIDSTHLNPEQVADIIEQAVRARESSFGESAGSPKNVTRSD